MEKKMKIEVNVYKKLGEIPKKAIGEFEREINSLNSSNVYDVIGRVTAFFSFKVLLGMSYMLSGDYEFKIVYFDMDSGEKNYKKEGLTEYDTGLYETGEIHIMI